MAVNVGYADLHKSLVGVALFDGDLLIDPVHLGETLSRLWTYTWPTLAVFTRRNAKTLNLSSW